MKREEGFMIGFGRTIGIVLTVVLLSVPPAAAGGFPFTTIESSQYMIIARNRVNGNTDIAANNFELGAMKSPVPCTDSFLNNGSTGGPTLLGAVPMIPAHAKPLFQDVGVYANPAIGIRIAGTSFSLNKSSNSFFNDPMHFPNTFNPLTQTGFSVNPNDADQSTRIDPPDNGGLNTGVTFGFNHAALLSELNSARTTINGLPTTSVLNTGSGIINSDTTITLAPGLNVIDIATGNNDFLLSNANLVIDGPEGSSAIFRLTGNSNMLISNGNILIGNGGIEGGSVMFYTDQPENDTHFSFSNTILNGIAFWSLGPNGGSIDISNAQGCVQLVADIVDLDDVRFNGCTFVPEPATLLFLAGAGLALIRRR
jgi:hypothetical protein